ncbi:MAG: DUF1566 domain-containing protein [Desulfobacteraceae bacterium]|nr:DUF1566 domain-containing protein [Desulfobacteraceae bacterium]
MKKRLFFSIPFVLLFLFALIPFSIAADRFTDNGDGTVTDHELGVMWATHDNNGDINWHQAVQWSLYTFPYTLTTWYDNWRLPSLTELQSLAIDDKRAKGYETNCGQWVKIVPYIRLSCGWIWTSETDPVAPTARVFNFNNVYHYTVRKVHQRAYRVLPVRDLE